MAGSVIDSLVVTLGLNASGFNQGIDKAGEGLASFTRRVAAMFIAVRGIEDVVERFKDLSEQLFHIGIDARNLDIAGTKLSQWAEVARLAGGHAEDAAASISSLNNSVFDLKYQGELSGSLMQLMRFGINPMRRTETGEMAPRDFTSLAKEASEVIQRRAPNDPAERLYLAQQMGFQGGIATAVADGGKGLEKALAEASVDQKALTEKLIANQVTANQLYIRNSERLAANSAVLLDKVTPALEKLNTAMVDLATKIEHLLTAFITEISPYLKDLVDILDNFVGSVKPATSGEQIATAQGSMFSKGFWTGSVKHAENQEVALEQKYGLPVFTLKKLQWGGAEDADKVAAEIAGIHGRLGDSDPDWSKTLAAYLQRHPRQAPRTLMEETHRVEGSIDKWLNRVFPTPGATRPATPSPAAVGASTTGRNAGTQVQIDSMTINTQATDANGIATDIRGALDRKLLVANTDPGMQ